MSVAIEAAPVSYTAAKKSLLSCADQADAVLRRRRERKVKPENRAGEGDAMTPGRDAQNDDQAQIGLIQDEMLNAVEGILGN